MRRVEEAQKLLTGLGLPKAQCNEISALTLLALARIGKKTPWEAAEAPRLRIHDILVFIEAEYERKYAENTREVVRRQVVHQLEQAQILERNPEDPSLSINSPLTHYALTPEVLPVIRSFGTVAWSARLAEFLAKRTTLMEVYAGAKLSRGVPVKTPDGKTLHLSPGKHNKLEGAVVEDFAPRFAPGALLLYLGDAAKKEFYLYRETLSQLNVPVDEHGKLPDVVLYHPDTKRLFLVEAVTSHGPVSPKRRYELEQLLSKVDAIRIYVSAFPDFKEFKSHITEIAWETEVWIQEIPDHLIHFNGDKFLR
jgi:type II restriction enzyme